MMGKHESQQAAVGAGGTHGTQSLLGGAWLRRVLREPTSTELNCLSPLLFILPPPLSQCASPTLSKKRMASSSDKLPCGVGQRGLCECLISKGGSGEQSKQSFPRIFLSLILSK